MNINDYAYLYLATTNVLCIAISFTTLLITTMIYKRLVKDEE